VIHRWHGVFSNSDLCFVCYYVFQGTHVDRNRLLLPASLISVTGYAPREYTYVMSRADNSRKIVCIPVSIVQHTKVQRT